VSTGKRGRGEEAAGEHPHRNAKLLQCLLDGGERRNGGTASDRSTAMAAAGKLRALMVFNEGGGCSLGARSLGVWARGSARCGAAS
jgi:hypothetical protein